MDEEAERKQDKRDAIHLLAVLRLMTEGDPPGSDIMACALGPFMGNLTKTLIEGYNLTDEELYNVCVKIEITDKEGLVFWKEGEV